MVDLSREVPKYVHEEIDRAIKEMEKRGADASRLRELAAKALSDPIVIEDMKAMIRSGDLAITNVRRCTKTSVGISLSELETAFFYGNLANKRGAEDIGTESPLTKIAANVIGEGWPNILGEIGRRTKLRWLNTLVDDCDCRLHEGGSYVSAEDKLTKPPSQITPKKAEGKKLPTRDQVRVEVWEERDRLHIGIQDKETGDYYASWWDDDARLMFEQGFFKSGPKLEESVLEYGEYIGILSKE